MFSFLVFLFADFLLFVLCFSTPWKQKTARFPGVFSTYRNVLVGRNGLTLPAQCISEGCFKIKNNLNFYFHTFLWCLRFYEGFKGLHKTFWGTTQKFENKNQSYFFSPRIRSGREGLRIKFNLWIWSHRYLQTIIEVWGGKCL